MGYRKKEFQLLLREQDKAYVSIYDDLIFLEDNSFYGQVSGMATNTFIIMIKMENY